MSDDQTERAASDTSGSMAKFFHPIDTAATVVGHVPGVSAMRKAANGVLETVGIVSPQARRLAAYTGMGLLGVAGVIEWPVAAGGAAIVWMTQARDGQPANGRRELSEGSWRNGGAGNAQPTAATEPGRTVTVDESDN
jgi:predicted phage gp36 major capsid-like protein